jgi:hypothetical protein
VGKHTARGFAVLIGILMLAALAPAANAGTLKVSSSSTVTGALPGQVLWTDYAAFQCADDLCVGDSVIRVINPNGACNVGCDPTQNPGYTVTTNNNLLGSRIYTIGPGSDVPQGLTEVALHDDGAGDPNNLTYLKTECGLLVGNGSGAAVCSCPVPGDSEPPSTS